MVSIIWAESANSDLIDIKEYISLNSVLQAELLIEAIFTKIQILSKYPEIGKPVPELPGTRYRELLFKRYRIIYRFSHPDIFILSIHHSARLLKNNPHFKDLLQ